MCEDRICDSGSPALCQGTKPPGQAASLLISPRACPVISSFQSLPLHSGLPTARAGVCPSIGPPTSREMPSAVRARGQHLPQLPVWDCV